MWCSSSLERVEQVLRVLAVSGCAGSTWSWRAGRLNKSVCWSPRRRLAHSLACVFLSPFEPGLRLCPGPTLPPLVLGVPDLVFSGIMRLRLVWHRNVGRPRLLSPCEPDCPWPDSDDPWLPLPLRHPRLLAKAHRACASPGRGCAACPVRGLQFQRALVGMVAPSFQSSMVRARLATDSSACAMLRTACCRDCSNDCSCKVEVRASPAPSERLLPTSLYSPAL